MNVRSFTISCSFLTLIAVALLSVGCKKGDTGPAGPAGPAGPTGATGAQGPKGDTGTANVIYSNWLDVTFDADTVHNGSIVDTVSWSTAIAAAKLTNSILSNGEIKVYVNLGSTTNPAVAPLPLDASAFGAIITPLFQVGSIVLISSDDVSTQLTTGNDKTLQYRYILIPGGTPSGRKATINWNNYNEVKAYLGLKD